MKYILLFFLISIYSFIVSQTLAEKIDSTYNFQPHEEKDLVAKGKILDGFWTMVKNDTNIYLPQLREELNKEHFQFFYYDGSMLLLSLSNSYADKCLAAEAIARCDTKDIIPAEYVKTVINLGLTGINTSKASLHILKDPDFKFFLSEHTFNFKHSYCLTYMLLPLSPDMYLDELKKSFKKLTPDLQTSVLTALWFTYSCEGDQFMKSVAKSKKYSSKIRKYAEDLLSRNQLDPKLSQALKEVFKEDLISEQNKMLSHFSDETTWSLDHLCRLRRSQNLCRE